MQQKSSPSANSLWSADVTVADWIRVSHRVDFHGKTDSPSIFSCRPWSESSIFTFLFQEKNDWITIDEDQIIGRRFNSLAIGDGFSIFMISFLRSRQRIVENGSIQYYQRRFRRWLKPRFSQFRFWNWLLFWNVNVSRSTRNFNSSSFDQIPDWHEFVSRESIGIAQNIRFINASAFPNMRLFSICKQNFCCWLMLFTQIDSEFVAIIKNSDSMHSWNSLFKLVCQSVNHSHQSYFNQGIESETFWGSPIHSIQIEQFHTVNQNDWSDLNPFPLHLKFRLLMVNHVPSLMNGRK
jgi:hypothetical protein